MGCTLDTAQAILELEVGQALVSILDETGKPTIVEQAAIYPPESRIGPLTATEKTGMINASPFFGQYEQAIDRQSAAELIAEKLTNEQASVENEVPKEKGRPRQSATEALITSTARSFGTQIGRQIVKSILNAIMGSKK